MEIFQQHSNTPTLNKLQELEMRILGFGSSAHAIISHYHFLLDYATDRRNVIKHKTPRRGVKPIFGLAPPLTRTPPFASVDVLVAPTLVQLSSPQDQLLGQQFPPSLAAQLYQPVAQVPEAVVVAAPVSGTTIVTPELIRVVKAVEGQLVVAQSLPTRQHPPAK
jgi:hypothetical protein